MPRFRGAIEGAARGYGLGNKEVLVL